jgi:broad-specificity NMP kinase
VTLVVLITGPPGAGKSRVAGALHDRWGDAGVANALLEVDHLERSHPPLPRERALRHLALLAAAHRQHGHDRLIVTATAEDDAYLSAVLAATGPGARFVVRLEAEPDTLERRLRAREPAGWSGLERLVANARALARSMPALAVDLALSTEGRRTEDVAAEVARALG